MDVTAKLLSLVTWVPQRTPPGSWNLLVLSTKAGRARYLTNADSI